MINLLPPKEKELLFWEKNRKIVMVLGTGILVVLVCLWLILLSLKIYTLGEVENQSIFSDSIERTYQTKEFITSRDIAKKYNTLLLGVDRFYKERVSFSDIVEAFLTITLPRGVSLTSLEINQSGTSNPLITVYGISDTRDNLVIFKNNINASPYVKNVSFPANNWIKPKDISFSLTFEIVLPHK